MKRTAGIVALALVVVSCGGGSSGDGATPATEPAQSPSATDSATPGSYETVRELQLDVEAAFILCNAPMTVHDPPLVEGALAQADCKRDVGLFIYAPDDVQTGVAALQAEGDAGQVLLVGHNWIVACSSERGDCEKIQGVTGGELIGGTS